MMMRLAQNISIIALFGSTSSVVEAMATGATKQTSPVDALTSKLKSIKPGTPSKPPLNPVDFGIKVVQSKEGQDAAAELVDGGLKIVGAILQEGKSSQVEVPSGFDRNGNLKTQVVSNVGVKELVDAGLFATGEAIGIGKRLYFGKGGYRPAPFKLTLPKSKAKGVLNPITFGLNVVKSEDGRAAAGGLVGGGLKLVKVALEEGSKRQLEVPTGYVDYRTGKPTFKAVNLGPKELIDVGLFAGSELFGVYNKLYFGDAKTQSKSKLTYVPEKNFVTKGKLIKTPAKVTYYVNVGGQRVKVNADQNRLL